MLNEIISVMFGIFSGIGIGLMPGMHVNVIAALLLSASMFNPLYSALFVMSCAISSLFFEFIKGTFMGLPSDETALNVLPSQRLLLKGHAMESIKISSLGCLYAILICICLSPILIKIYPVIYPIIKKYIGILLLLSSIALIARDRKKLDSIFVFVITGVIGFVVLHGNLLNYPLVPMFSGFFGMGFLLNSIRGNRKIPPQIYDPKIGIRKREFIGTAIVSVLSSAFFGLLPAIGPTQAALFINNFIKESRRKFLLATASISSSYNIIALFTAFAINKPRSGALYAIKSMIKLSGWNYVLLIGVALVSAIIAYFLSIKIGRIICQKIRKINYRKLCLISLCFIVTLVFLLDNFKGIAVLFICSVIGYYVNRFDIRRSTCTASIVFPTMLYYFS